MKVMVNSTFRRLVDSGSYRIEFTEDPTPYKNDIFALWDTNLPGTPHGRLEWLAKGNPAGPTVWLLAFKVGSKKLIGTVSITPRLFFKGWSTLRVGIVGDLMVNRENQVFGPAIQLVKNAGTLCSKLGFNFFYTMPNEMALKLMLRCKFHVISSLPCLVCPVSVRMYFEKFLPHFLSRSLSEIIDEIISIRRRMIVMGAKGVIETATELNDSFDDLWRVYKNQLSGTLISDRSTDYLNWRYFLDPHFRFQVMTYKRTKTAKISGYIIYTISNGIIDIFDILAIDGESLRGLIIGVQNIAYAENCRNIYFIGLGTGNWERSLKRFGFIQTKDKLVPVLGIAGKSLPPERWLFMKGDGGC